MFLSAFICFSKCERMMVCKWELTWDCKNQLVALYCAIMMELELVEKEYICGLLDFAYFCYKDPLGIIFGLVFRVPCCAASSVENVSWLARVYGALSWICAYTALIWVCVSQIYLQILQWDISLITYNFQSLWEGVCS